MEKFFRPNKYLVIFCAIFLLVCGLYQLVVSMRLCDMAKFAGSDVFTWYYPPSALHSQGNIEEAGILRRTETDATVQVKGKQTVWQDSKNASNNIPQKSETFSCAAILTLYRASNHWVLGKVELQ